MSDIESRTAGRRIIRGGAVRGAGFLLGTGLTALAFALLLRHLGVADFGRFSTVIALVTIAAGLAEGGLQTIGQRRYGIAADERERAGVVADVLGIRLVVTPIAIALATAFAVAAGYGATMVWGTVVAGAGAALVVVAGTFAFALVHELRYATLTFVELGRQLAIVAGIAALAIAGASLGPFFFTYLAAGGVMVALTAVVVGRDRLPAPRFARASWGPIVRETAPLALSVTLNVFYLKLLIVLTSLLVSDDEVGVFATASRVTEVLVGLPMYVVGTALPLLAHAGVHDEERLAYAMRRLAEGALLIGAFFAVVLVVAAEPIIDVFAGPGYDEAIGVLRIQAFALIGASLTQTWLLGVITVGANRALIAVNALALVSVGVLGAALIPPLGATGASITAIAGETLLAGATLVVLLRARPALRPSIGQVPRVAVALAAGLACAFVPAPPALNGVLAAAVFVLAAAALRAIPTEIFQAFSRPAQVQPADGAPPPSPGGADG